MSVLYSRLDPFGHNLKTPVRIAFGITDLDVGGAEKALVQLVTRLDRTLWTPSVVCLQPAGPLFEPLREAGAAVNSLELRSWRELPSVCHRWRRHLQKHRPAILQTFLFHANLLGRLVGRGARVPVVVSGVRVAERRAKGHLLADRLTQRLCDAHVCVSRSTAEFQRLSAGIPSTRLAVIPNGVSQIDSPSNPQSSILNPRPSLVFVGRLDSQKGVDVLLEALATLPAEKRPEIAIVGAGAERPSLEEQSRRLGLDECVRFVGWQANPRAWMLSADALVLPSRWEGMPNVVLEAMVLGKPVIATDVEGVRDLIDDGVHGWIARPNDPHSLADAVARFIAARDRWSAFGDAGRVKARTEFSIERMVRSYETLWLSLLERWRQKTQPGSHRVRASY
jgi:glycosyltransferase involved in cell wall biosynthesis